MGTCLPSAKKVEEGAYYTLERFHPSYDYTDFVEGLRPVEAKDGGNRFVKLDGQFKVFCREVADWGDHNGKYFFIIDEINRAELQGFRRADVRP